MDSEARTERSNPSLENTMRKTSVDSGKVEKILAAAGSLEGLDHAALHAIMLARRTGMSACLLLVRNTVEEGRKDETKERTINKKFEEIRKAGAAEGVGIDCHVGFGLFVDEVVRHLTQSDAAILVVSEGSDRRRRREELLEIGRRTRREAKGQGSPPRQLLMVSRKAPPPDSDPVSTITY